MSDFLRLQARLETADKRIGFFRVIPEGITMVSYLHKHLCAGHMIIRPEPVGLCAARRQVTMLAKELGFTEDDATDIVIAVGEAMSNAYLYGTPDLSRNYIYLGWHCSDDILSITIDDEGQGIVYEKQELRPCKLTEFRGNGLPLMRKTMDNVRFDYIDGTTVVLEKRMPGLRLSS